MKENRVRVLSGKDLKSVLTMPDCIEAMRKAFTALAENKVTVPLRTAIDLVEDNGGALVMPVYSAAISKVGVKTVMINRDNPAKGLPFIHATVMLFDSATGAPVALMDGEVITAMRTGAVSGLATQLMAREDARVAAIIGAGAQGETQLEGVCAVRAIEGAYVFDLDRHRAEVFASKMTERLEIEVVAAKSSKVLAEAEVICTSTSSPVPVFADTDIALGTHINGVGSYRPDMAEISPETLLRAKIIVDQRHGCLAEAGDLLQPIRGGLFTADHIHGELGELVTGRIDCRTSTEEITVFKSVGIAVQDLLTVDLALALALQAGVGQEVCL